MAPSRLRATRARANRCSLVRLFVERSSEHMSGYSYVIVSCVGFM
nr:MAG TPA: hypothetical protein [Bacteriophage sp.]